ncbi:MAG: methylenetetrahydrofolate--tRNA-(uracil(54)-C(5))-methyltransferase (FADH(2)-oxidizing) TrmFO [Anaerolineales bacterium]|nr:methylenetetrahydrofolate--tRNA-(uracil(54)-C(5))-methyltransferase (FADH(2)-oxidizing) TrmFO [Anaerolineales bacterium]
MADQARAPTLTVLGGGLAGSEAAWQAAERGIAVRLVEMRPGNATGAHRGGDLAELVCSNSLGSALPDRAAGVLQHELERMGSLLMACARECAVPAGAALAVDRERFARLATEKIFAHPRIEVVREEAVQIPSGPAVVATGPLTSPALSESLRTLTGVDHLYFYDAVAPIVVAESIDRRIAFSDSRNSLSADYLNCPLNGEEYARLVEELARAETIPLQPFEEDIRRGVRAGTPRFFEGCLPVEILARRGPETLAYGALRPVGLRDPRSGEKPCAVVQLRQENAARTLYNLVGFQTNLKEAEQRRVFRMIPGLERAEFVRYGQMHRNTFLNAPRLLLATLQFRDRPDLFFAGQLTGVEGYVGNIGTGLLAGRNAARLLRGLAPIVPPPETMLGALCLYVTRAEESHFQPMKTNFGLLPPVRIKRKRRLERNQAHAERAYRAFEGWIERGGLQD